MGGARCTTRTRGRPCGPTHNAPNIVRNSQERVASSAYRVGMETKAGQHCAGEPGIPLWQLHWSHLHPCASSYQQHSLAVSEPNPDGERMTATPVGRNTACHLGP